MSATSTPLTQIENRAVEQIFETYLVRSYEVETVKSVWEKLKKCISFGPNIFLILSCFSAQLGENPNLNSLV